MNLFEAKKILHSFGYTLNESKELVTKFWSVSKAMKQHEVIELSDSEKEEATKKHKAYQFPKIHVNQLLSTSFIFLSFLKKFRG